MKFNYSFIFIIPLAMILIMDNAFTELAFPHNLEAQGNMLNLLLKGMAAVSFGYSAFYFKRMSPVMRVAYVLTTLYVFAMVFESYYFYGTPMVYPHVFQKLFLFYFIFFVYTFYKGNFHLKFSHVVWFILGGFWVSVIVVHPDKLSLGAFTSHERGVYASSVYMLVIPFMYFLSKYIFHGKLMSLFMAFFILVSIVFFQHRTVWISTAIILIIYYLLIRFKSGLSINFAAKFMPIGIVLLIAGITSSAFLFSTNPEIITKIQDSFSDIENFDSQGTGGWRYIQWMSYLPFIQDNWLVGMRFEGFELPIQFWRDDTNEPVFDDGQGHHFHSFYVDILFYTGFVGLAIYCIMPIYAIVKGLRSKAMTVNQIILIAFISTGFAYGFSYVLPVFYYAILGWTIVYMEEDGVERTSYLRDFGSRWKAKAVGQYRKLTAA
ncbi:O-antigen ligase family protein [Pontibacter sp. BT731]|uniref:O-antigen ligase family protein n=1 Tax=Pontibacter coccineus TaxID=3063328 RepID=UPI0026E337F3|nr:O-antigen ligase family protein [Pontibacter sp. BT731]MDO6388880.1 O-antigen ligase family protein [Pontibacter sp. BT731]